MCLAFGFHGGRNRVRTCGPFRVKEVRSRCAIRPYEQGREMRPWSLLAPRVGFEPTTTRLTAEGSAVELPRNPRLRANRDYRRNNQSCKMQVRGIADGATKNAKVTPNEAFRSKIKSIILVATLQQHMVPDVRPFRKNSLPKAILFHLFAGIS